MRARKRQHVLVVVTVLLAVLGLATTRPSSGEVTVSETVRHSARTWTDPSSAGGAAGPPIEAHTTVRIACRLRVSAVAGGDDWWYRIASSPWNYALYASAGDFYDATPSSRLARDRAFDPALPECAGTAATGTDVGIAQDSIGARGDCTAPDLVGGPPGQPVASSADGPQIVRPSVLAGGNGAAAPAYRCPTGDEFSYAAGARQAFAAGSLYRSPDTTVARRVSWGELTDNHWSGYAAQGSLVSSVRAVWRQPVITCEAKATERSEAVFWAGIDGMAAEDGLIQAGSGGSCRPGSSKAASYLWYETNPHLPMTRFRSVDPGDTIEVKVDYMSAEQRYSMSISVNGAVVKAVSGRLAENGHSGECVAEATVGPAGVVRLARFSRVTFTTCTVSTAPHPHPVPIATGALPSEVLSTRITMAGAGGALKTTTSLPGDDGSWGVSWLRP